MEDFIYRIKRWLGWDVDIIEDSTDFLYKYGKINAVFIQKFNKFSFVVEIETSGGYRLLMRTGGTYNAIERYNPLAHQWQDHFQAGIKWYKATKVRAREYDSD